MPHTHRMARAEQLKKQARVAKQKLEATLQDLERRLDAGAVIEDGPFTFDRESRRIVPNPNWKDEAK